MTSSTLITRTEFRRNSPSAVILFVTLDHTNGSHQHPSARSSFARNTLNTESHFQVYSCWRKEKYMGPFRGKRSVPLPPSMLASESHPRNPSTLSLKHTHARKNKCHIQILAHIRKVASFITLRYLRKHGVVFKIAGFTLSYFSFFYNQLLQLNYQNATNLKADKNINKPKQMQEAVRRLCSSAYLDHFPDSVVLQLATATKL